MCVYIYLCICKYSIKGTLECVVNLNAKLNINELY